MASSSKRQLGRREFLRASGLLGLTAGLSSCTSLDRYVLGDYKEEADRVVILGAGLAGLMAAFELRKQGVQVHVFEASARLGGRTYTVPDFFRGQSVAELGAEWFSSQQKIVFELAKELRLEVVDLKDMEQKIKLRRGNQLKGREEIQKELSRFQRSISKAENPELLQKQSLADWVKARSKETAFLDYVNAWSLERYGAPASEVTAVFFASSFDQARPAYSPWADSTYRFRSGSSSLAQALFDRTAGFQPERVYSFKHRLKAVRKRTLSTDLIFDTPAGEKTVSATAIICALPLACLSEIDGIQDIGAGPWSDPAAFKVGQHSKFITSFQERFWGATWDQTKMLKFAEGQTAWESSYRLNPLFQFRQGVISVLWGGEASQAAGPTQQASLLHEIEELFVPAGKQVNTQVIDQVMVNWSRQPFAKGSVSYPRPGAAANAWDEVSDSWVWAGEHTRYEDRGSLAGALESGRRAAAMIIAHKPQRLFGG